MTLLRFRENGLETETAQRLIAQLHSDIAVLEAQREQQRLSQLNTLHKKLSERKKGRLHEKVLSSTLLFYLQ